MFDFIQLPQATGDSLVASIRTFKQAYTLKTNKQNRQKKPYTFKETSEMSQAECQDNTSVTHARQDLQKQFGKVTIQRDN